MRYAYNLFLFLILPFLPLRLWWRSRKNIDYRKNILERFAYFNFPSIKECIWVHAVSVGEALAAVPLIKILNVRYPQTKIVVTTMTPTGRERLQKAFNNQEILLLYAPYDYPFVIKSFLRQFNPKILILIETEIWPNILHYSFCYKIPVIIGNARLSAKSLAGYEMAHDFISSILNHVTLIIAQSKIDAKRFQSLGVDPQKITTAGNIKFDVTIPEDLLTEARKLRLTLGKERAIWVAASTHKMEEEKVLLAARKVLETIPNALLILVPRHPERFDNVYNLCEKQGFKVVRYSTMGELPTQTNVILGDVMGQLLLFYATADVAFVGGSLVPWGGHNLLEPAALAKPIITGPNLNSFLEISQTLTEANAMLKVNDELELAQNLLLLFANQSLREKLGVAALDIVEKHRGVVQKIVTMITGLIK